MRSIKMMWSNGVALWSFPTVQIFLFAACGKKGRKTCFQKKKGQYVRVRGVRIIYVQNVRTRARTRARSYLSVNVFVNVSVNVYWMCIECVYVLSVYVCVFMESSSIANILLLLLFRKNIIDSLNSLNASCFRLQNIIAYLFLINHHYGDYCSVFLKNYDHFIYQNLKIAFIFYHIYLVLHSIFKSKQIFASK